MLLTSLLISLAPAIEPARLTAAEALEARLMALPADPAAALVELRAAAASAVAELGKRRVASMIEQEVLDARWQAVIDPAAAVAELTGDLSALASDLRFEPLMEAEMPPGFPEPTPLHEIRLTEYPGYRLAYADMNGPRDGSAFFKLFQHIQTNEIAMTAPVEITFDGRRMEQTKMAFLYEGPTQGETGTDGPVEVVDIAPMTVVSIGCRGNDSMGRVESMTELLRQWVTDNPDWDVAGDPRTMGFNSPMVRGDRRFFEVQLPVRPAQLEEDTAEAGMPEPQLRKI